MIAYSILGSADAGWIDYAAGPFAALAGLYGPALTNMMSSRVSESEQGELQGAIGSAQGLALMAGPLAMTFTFSLFGDTANKAARQMQGFPDNFIGISKYYLGLIDVPYVPGSPFLLAAAFSLLAFVTFLIATNKADRDARYSPAQSTGGETTEGGSTDTETDGSFATATPEA